MEQYPTNDNLLNIAATCVGTRSLGPGWRSALWVQGCQLRCRGCVAPEWIPQVTARLIHPTNLASELLHDTKIDGITISGGEPMLQAKGLARLIETMIRIRPVNVICFSGYRYEWLLNQPESTGIRSFLSRIDLLIDGPYVENENNNLGLRGSKNQRFIHLTKKLADFEFENNSRKIEIHIEDGQLLMVGVPPHTVKATIDGSIDRIESMKAKRGKYVWS
jgi:anaerobic ribonucleoside-triphosphate reductase activating protein